MSNMIKLPMDEQIQLRRAIAEHLSMMSADERARVESSVPTQQASRRAG